MMYPDPDAPVLPFDQESGEEEEQSDEDQAVMLTWQEELHSACPDEGVKLDTPDDNKLAEDPSTDDPEDIIHNMAYHLSDPPGPLHLEASGQTLGYTPEKHVPPAFVEVGFEGLMARTHFGVPRQATIDETVVTYLSSDYQESSVIVKEFDALTPEELRTHANAVGDVKRKEIADLHSLGCFGRCKRRDARNLVDTRWVIRWKEVDGKKVIKPRLTMRGFKDSATSLETFAGTASRWSQRVVNPSRPPRKTLSCSRWMCPRRLPRA